MDINIEETKLLAEKADHILDEIFATGKYEGFIKGMVNHGNFSLKNQALIMQYAPGATDMKGMRTWNYMGRYVKDNEYGTPTLSPVFDKTNKDDGKKQGPLIGFRVNYRFDVSQTGGAAYRPLRCQEDEIYKYEERILKALEGVLSWRGKDGELNPYSLRSIFENENFKKLDSEEKVRIVTEEVNEKLLIRKLMNPRYKGLVEAEKIGINEVMLSAINYITLTRLGLDSEDIVIPNIYEYTAQEYEKLKESLNTIRQISQIVITAAETAVTLGRKDELLEVAKESVQKGRADEYMFESNFNQESSSSL